MPEHICFQLSSRGPALEPRSRWQSHTGAWRWLGRVLRTLRGLGPRAGQGRAPVLVQALHWGLHLQAAGGGGLEADGERGARACLLLQRSDGGDHVGQAPGARLGHAR
eukprot:950525-Pyramimonas_sp.AAC.1